MYQKALEFSDLVHDAISSFPKHELYSLASQFSRASNGISLTIAEGHGDTDKQFNRYLKMAEGSVRECVGCSTLAYRRGYIDNQAKSQMRKILIELAKMIKNLRKKLD
ncbi:four helix bundle protein [Nonlabens spongiae]|uniref:four helix bundle protein n=1 Tax=Nonlabens spongiae TaxID=331648 RepID=UPI001FE5D888|nr:four helix bundle protein [Nonlabens spongiae]